MTHDILSVKLYELDKAIGQMHSRIEQGEMDCPEQVEKDIQELRRECRENREMLHNKMKYSKAKLVGRIAEAYDKVDQVIQIAQEQLGISYTEETTKELSAENKILNASLSAGLRPGSADGSSLRFEYKGIRLLLVHAAYVR